MSRPGFPLLTHVCGPARAQVLPRIQWTEGWPLSGPHSSEQSRASLLLFTVDIFLFQTQASRDPHGRQHQVRYLNHTGLQATTQRFLKQAREKLGLPPENTSCKDVLGTAAPALG